ncbi:TPA: hypothetical protein P0E24_002348 [Vibrio campbellii]|uniref:hypothetical protein n=1 Tax=Vibrio sp. M260121 TaxID=3020897 RepID=UPI002F42C523|nr:hypothetical protein [Vibrio campbellii]HDM8243268.1 hypothetical protein [Vibrio campbellii]
MAKHKIILTLSLVVSMPCSFMGSAAETLIFPVSTTINKALLSNYSITTSLNRSYVPLTYDADNEKFLDEDIYVTNQTNIPDSEAETYKYNYFIDEFVSQCESDTDVYYQNFMELYINDVKFESNEQLDTPFSLTGLDGNSFKNATDKFTLKTGIAIPKDKPVYCHGHVNYVVELFL